MTYAEFKIAYTKAFENSMKYSLGQVGSKHYIEKMADLAEAYPEFEAELEAELV